MNYGSITHEEWMEVVHNVLTELEVEGLLDPITDDLPIPTPETTSSLNP